MVDALPRKTDRLLFYSFRRQTGIATDRHKSEQVRASVDGLSEYNPVLSGGALAPISHFYYICVSFQSYLDRK